MMSQDLRKKWIKFIRWEKWLAYLERGNWIIDSSALKARTERRNLT